MNVVSVAYGKYANKTKTENIGNQSVIHNQEEWPMENLRQGYGKKVMVPDLFVSHTTRFGLEIKAESTKEICSTDAVETVFF